MSVSQPNWVLPVVLELVTALCFLFVALYPPAAKITPDSHATNTPLTRVLLVAFALLCPLTLWALLPSESLTANMEKWLLKNPADSSLPSGLFSSYAFYNAGACTVVGACVFVAYMRLLERYYQCAQSKGEWHLQQSKDKEQRVSFALDMEGTAPTLQAEQAGFPRETRRRAGVFAAIFAACVLLLPTHMQYTFAYTIVDGAWLRITSDHVWASAALFFAAEMARRLWFGFTHFPAGFCKGLFAAGQFTLCYGSMVCVSAVAFLAFAGDVMMTYTYKLFRLYQMHMTQPLLQAADVSIPHANAMSSGFANYLVDTTYASLDPDASSDMVLAVLRLLVMYYRARFINCIQILYFACLVFAPMTMVLLVSIRR